MSSRRELSLDLGVTDKIADDLASKETKSLDKFEAEEAVNEESGEEEEEMIPAAGNKLLSLTSAKKSDWCDGAMTRSTSSGKHEETWKSISAETPDIWEAQLSLDCSPGSGKLEEGASSRAREDSEDSEQDSLRERAGSRRRSPSKRGSSSGSDVALHEGAELSPLEDDQGTPPSHPSPSSSLS